MHNRWIEFTTVDNAIERYWTVECWQLSGRRALVTFMWRTKPGRYHCNIEINVAYPGTHKVVLIYDHLRNWTLGTRWKAFVRWQYYPKVLLTIIIGIRRTDL